MGSSEQRETFAGGVILKWLGMSGSQKQVPLSSFTHRACKVRMGCTVHTQHKYTRYMWWKRLAMCKAIDNLVEAHCYGIGKTGQLLSNHVAVETDRNVRRFDRKGLTFLSVSTAM